MFFVGGAVVIAQYPFESRFVSVGGQRMHYIDEGSGPILLMVHGNPTWSYYWRRLVSNLSSEYRVIAVDHIGCGFSDKPQKNFPYRLQTHVDNLLEFIDRVKIKRYTLFGHDWGGAIGTGAAVDQPNAVSGLVLFNTAAFRSDQMPWQLSLCRIPLFGKFAIQGCNAFARGATVLACERPLTREVKRGYLAPYNSYRNRIATYEFVKDIPLKPSHPSWNALMGIEEKLTRLRSHPMQLIWGAKDWCFHLGFLEQWRVRFPQAGAHVEQDAGHYVLEDAFPTILPVVQKFLRKHS